jgi:hypothetical protein
LGARGAAQAQGCLIASQRPPPASASTFQVCTGILGLSADEVADLMAEEVLH